MIRLLRCRLLTALLSLCMISAAAHAQDEPPNATAPDFVALDRQTRAVESWRSYVEALPDRRRACETIAWPLAQGAGKRERLLAESVRQRCLRAMIDHLLTLQYGPSANGGESMALRVAMAVDVLRAAGADLAAGISDCDGKPCDAAERSLIVEIAYTEHLADLLASIVRLNGPRDAKHPGHFPDRWLAAWRAAGGPPRQAASDATPSQPADDDMQEPDYDAIGLAAQRTDPSRDYVAILPDRWAECRATARLYSDAGTTAGMRLGTFVRSACLKAMLIKMAAIYYDSESFEPKTFAAIVDGTEDDTYLLFHGIYNENPACRPWCGTMYHVMPGGAVEDAFRNAVLAMAWAQLNGGDAWDDWDARWKQAEFD